MSQQDYYNRCGNCTSFRFEGDGIKGYCSYYRAYCYPNDTCSKQENASSSSAGCFLTTVCCKEKGLPDDCKEQVFERFYRVDKSRSKATGGTGLGLAIVKHIAEVHHAEISLQSAIGVGTEITVTFC